MAPETHLFTSWLIAARTTNNPRDCRLLTLAGILPDLDGLGIIVDGLSRAFGYRGTQYYAIYHHYLLHGFLGGIGIALLVAAFARQRWRVALLALVLFHLHLACDFVGSRGPAPEDLWPIYYFGPLDRDPMWIWKGQWRLDAWQNRWFTVVVFFAGLWTAVRLGYSFVGVFNRRVDAVFVGVLRKWYRAVLTKLGRSPGPIAGA